MNLYTEPSARAPKKRRLPQNPQSQEAWETVQEDLTERERAVLKVIASHSLGATMKEVARELGVPLNTVSGRAISLRRKGLVEPQFGLTREKSQVLFAVRARVPGQQSLFSGVA